jgi:2-dehydropantoate 2-reductase
MDLNTNDIVVIGAGCVGQTLTASFLKSNKNNRVFLISSHRSVRKTRMHGITIQGAIEQTFFPNEQFIVKTSLTKKVLSKFNISKNTVIFLATKAYSAVNSLTVISDLLLSEDYKLSIICLQNGLGIEEEITAAIQQTKAISILKGHVFSALHSRGNAIFAYKGDLIIQKPPTTYKNLEIIFGNPGSGIFNLKLVENILPAIYPKLVVNCVCNPLTVIFNKSLGVLRAHSDSITRRICHEVYKVGIAEGIYFGSSDYLVQIVFRAMEEYAEHYSSMYLDMKAGKKQKLTELMVLLWLLQRQIK